MILVIGGSGSGKSEYAERLVCNQAGRMSAPLFYLATMKVYDALDEEKVKRHRNLRAGKGFETVELPVDIRVAADIIKDDNAAVLLECISNLTANEMFTENGQVPAELVAEKITREVLILNKKFANLVVVTDDIFAEPLPSDTSVCAYAEALAKINANLAKEADELHEIVAGIGIRHGAGECI